MLGLDNVEGLRNVLVRCHSDKWSLWQDHNGRTLSDAAEDNARDAALTSSCAEYLRMRLQREKGVRESNITYVNRSGPRVQRPVSGVVPSAAPISPYVEPVQLPNAVQVPAVPARLVPGPMVPMSTLTTPQVVYPNAVDKAAEAAERGDRPVIVEVPLRRSQTITMEIPRVSIAETTETTTAT